jgi:rubrerythrin
VALELVTSRHFQCLFLFKKIQRALTVLVLLCTISIILKGNKMPFEKTSVTLDNLASALAGESQAHVKYRYFAKIAREEGYEEVARHFEHTADQELLHAWGHLELLIGKPTTKECLEMAIAGETYEFTTMYPEFKAEAESEGNTAAVAEANAQIEESREHAEQFAAVLARAEKRFAALAKVEQRHAQAYQQVLETL